MSRCWKYFILDCPGADGDRYGDYLHLSPEALNTFMRTFTVNNLMPLICVGGLSRWTYNNVVFPFTNFQIPRPIMYVGAENSLGVQFTLLQLLILVLLYYHHIFYYLYSMKVPLRFSKLNVNGHSNIFTSDIAIIIDSIHVDFHITAIQFYLYSTFNKEHCYKALSKRSLESVPEAIVPKNRKVP